MTTPRLAPGTRGKARTSARFRKPSRTGLVLFSLLLTVFSGFLIYRLYQIQIVDYAVNAQTAAAQHYKKVAEMPRRGLIYDRNGIEIAGTTYVYQIGITPKDIRSLSENLARADIAAETARLLDLPVAQVMAQFETKDAAYVQLKKDVVSEQAEALKAYLSEHNIGGFAIDSEPRRYYTNEDLASQVIGYTRYDLGNLIGQLGLEMQYNELLTGSPGYTYVETDNYKNKGELPFSVPTSLRAKDGYNLNLSLDINIQRIVQEELAEAVRVHDVTEGGTAIVMNPYTGSILAMASYPFFESADPTAVPSGFDPELWDDTSQASIDYLTGKVWRNRAISDTYEPGSTFKAITTAIAFDENLSHEGELFSDNPMRVLGQQIRCYTIVGHGTESVQDAFWHSCNPIFAQLAQRVGVSRYYQYIRAFGFRQVTGIDLPAEAIGQIHTDPTELDMVTLSYGESATITPIQLVSAYAAFANGGNLIRPRLVERVTDDSGSVVREFQPETVRKVISEKSATRVRELLKGVVLYGTGSKAYVEGYAVAGKTSTSTDEAGDHTLSFVSIAPADSPEIVTLVVLNKPVDKLLTSAIAAVPTSRIISRTLEYLGQARIYSEQDVSRLSRLIGVPSLDGLTLSQARKELTRIGLDLEAVDSGMGEQSVIRFQSPAPLTELHTHGIVYVYAEPGPVTDYVVVPDFTSKTVNECLSAAAASGLNIRIDGNSLGLAASQDVPPTHGQASRRPEATDDPNQLVESTEPAEGTEIEAETGSETQADGTEGTTVEGEEPADEGAFALLVDGKLPRGSLVTIQFEASEELPTSSIPVEETAPNP